MKQNGGSALFSHLYMQEPCQTLIKKFGFLRLSQAYRGLFLWKRRVKICFWPNNLWTKFSSAKFQLRPLTTGTYMSRETCQDCSWPPHWFALSLHHITKRHRHPKWFYDFERMQFGLPHCALKSKTCFRYSSSTPIRLQAKKAGQSDLEANIHSLNVILWQSAKFAEP